jgi:hypothetical protein
MEFKPGDIVKHKSGIIYLITAPSGSDGSKWSVVCLINSRTLGPQRGHLIPFEEENFMVGPDVWTKLGSLDELRH